MEGDYRTQTAASDRRWRFGSCRARRRADRIPPQPSLPTDGSSCRARVQPLCHGGIGRPSPRRGTARGNIGRTVRLDRGRSGTRGARRRGRWRRPRRRAARAPPPGAAAYHRPRPHRTRRPGGGLRRHDPARAKHALGGGRAAPCGPRRHLRDAVRRRRRAPAARRHRHGQAGGRRTQRFVRHRPRLHLSRGRRDRRRAWHRQSRILRPPGPAGHRRAQRPHSGWLRVPRRHAAAPVR